MFTPKRMPKEGRSPPGLPYPGSSSSKRGRLSQRQAILIFVVIICIPLVYYFTSSEAAISNSGVEKLKPDDSTRLVNLQDNKKPQKSTGDKVSIPDIVKDESPPPAKPKPVAKPKVDEDEDEDTPAKPEPIAEKPVKKPVAPEADDEDDDELVKPKPKSGKSESVAKHKQGPNAEKWEERPDFDKALEKVINMMPDEVTVRELTREITVTGKDRLKEMGLRTRSYKKYFGAWENLHLVEDEEGSVRIRDDVIQYLRSHKNGGAGDRSLGDTVRIYEAYRTFLMRFSDLLFPWIMPYFPDHMSLHAHFKKGGRGIVLTAGDDQAPYLLVTIHTFRQLGCNLPIEVMYLGDGDLGADYRAQLEQLDGVITRDIAQMVNDDGWRLAGWAVKPFAILLSSFREVIFIDADSLFFRDPELLFEEPGYKENGALFFKDRMIMPESKKRWLQQVLPAPIPKKAKQSRFWTGESGHMQESGVVVVDKWKHFIPLLLVTRMNGPDRDGAKEKGIIGVYDMVYGDKETFWVAWLLTGTESYHFHEGDAGIMGLVKEEDDIAKAPAPRDAVQPTFPIPLGPGHPENYTICAPQLLHLDTNGKPYWFNGWLLDNKFAERSKKRFADFRAYLVEPPDVREPGSWQLAESNMCCLTSDADHLFEFDAADRKVLKMIMDRANAIKAYGNQ